MFEGRFSKFFSRVSVLRRVSRAVGALVTVLSSLGAFSFPVGPALPPFAPLPLLLWLSRCAVVISYAC